MDPVKKVQFERRLVIGFALVLLVLLIKGPLKGFGLFGSSVRPGGTSSATGTGSGSLKILAQKYTSNVEVDPAILPTTAQPREEPLAPMYTAQGLRDPFKSLLPAAPSPQGSEPRGAITAARGVQPPAAPPELLIQGLMWGGPQPKAIIHGKVYGVGELVEGVNILSIDHHGVTIEYQGKPMSYPVAAPTSAASRRLQQPRPPMARGGNWR